MSRQLNRAIAFLFCLIAAPLMTVLPRSAGAVSSADSTRVITYVYPPDSPGSTTFKVRAGGMEVFVYRTSAVTYWIGKRLASVSSIGLPNILAGEPFLPELIHHACRPDRMADEVEALLADGPRRAALAARCVALRELLRGPGPAEAVVDMLAAAGGDAWA